MVWLFERAKSLKICLAVSTECRRVTDKRTDRQVNGQTDILRRHSPRYAYASHGNCDLSKYTP